MRILLFGKNGQVGWELNRSLQPLGEVIALGREEADFSDPESLREIVRSRNPDVIVNAVAYTAVDKAESEEALAITINGVTPGVLAEEALKLGALLVHYSTDYVFDGTKGSPYVEADEPNPVNAYGRTKLVGEKAVQLSGCDYLIFRTTWVYASRGHNFLLTILRLAQEKDELNVVGDQVGSPTSARLIAETTLVALLQSNEERLQGKFSSGLYHLTASGSTSWHGFAKFVLNDADKELNLKFENLHSIKTSEYPTPAKRPMNSQLCSKKAESAFTIELPEWDKALKLCVDELKAKRC